MALAVKQQFTKRNEFELTSFKQIFCLDLFNCTDLKSLLLDKLFKLVNTQEHWWWWWWWWIVFVVRLTDEGDRDHYQRFSPSRAGFEPAQNMSSGFDEWSRAVVITTTSSSEFTPFPFEKRVLISRSILI